MLHFSPNYIIICNRPINYHLLMYIILCVASKSCKLEKIGDLSFFQQQDVIVRRFTMHTCTCTSHYMYRANYNSLTSDICQVNISECQGQVLLMPDQFLHCVRPCKVEISFDRHNVSPAADSYNLPCCT